jgi:predicted ATPase
MALWFLGYPDQSLRRINEAQTLAQTLAHPYSMVAALNRSAFVGQFCQENRATREWAETAVGIATEYGLPRHAALGTILRGWALTRQGQGHEGMAQIRQGLVAYRELGMAMEGPYFLGLLADAYASSGEIEPGLAALADALARLPRGRGFFYEAELYRLRGELLLRQATPDALQAEECIHQALAVAHRQKAKSLELRATMSLSRLWQQQGKPGEARQLLAEIYAWFTEGFDTVDLREARALLTTLTG